MSLLFSILILFLPTGNPSKTSPFQHKISPVDFDANGCTTLLLPRRWSTDEKNVLQGSGLDQHVLLVSSVSRVLLFFQQVNRWIHALWQVVLVLPRLVLRSISDCHTVESIGESRDVNEKSMPHMEGRQGNGETSNVCMCVSAGQGTTTTLKR